MFSFKKIIYLFCLILVTQSFAKKEALVVGVSDYKAQNSDLPGIEMDVETMHNLLSSWGFNVTTLMNKKSINLENYLQMYANTLTKDDTFVFYFSGHGSYIIDQNGDEADGQDETIVLSDGKSDYHYLDDELNYRLNQIKAKKLILFDSCHSGTANRGASKLTPKTIPSEKVLEVYAKNKSRITSDKEGTFVVLSASKDKEQSRASQTGSLFTTELNKVLTNNHGKDNDFLTLQNETTINIVNRCKRSKVNPHHPNLSASDKALEKMSIYKYLSVDEVAKVHPKDGQDLEAQLNAMFNDRGISKISLTENKDNYAIGDKVCFRLDTKRKEGYLTILYVEKDEVTVLYPNRIKSTEKIGGTYHFPKDFGNFHLEAYKNCRECKPEKTTVYLLLTPKPFVNIEEQTAEKLLSFKRDSEASKVMSKAVKIVEENKEADYELAIGKYEFFVH
jgi:hypothetical protein